MPVFLVIYFLPIEDARMWAMGVLLISFVTDMFDGFIARTFNQITNLGKILDPIADKIMQITVLICLAIFNKSLIWIVVFVFIKDAILCMDEELFLFASPWSPPAFMKTNESVVGGGKLKEGGGVGFDL